MSIVKARASVETKSTIPKNERILLWFIRLIISGLIFFVLLASTLKYIDENILPIYFIYLGAVFFIVDFSSFFLSYATIKLLFGILFNKKVRSLAVTIKNRKRVKKFWIYFIVLAYEIFFWLSLTTINNKISLSIYILAWIGLWITARIISKVLYFLFYDF